MKYKKSLSIFLCAAMCSAVLAGCGGQNENTDVAIDDSNVTAAGEFPVVKEPITLTVGVPGDSKITDYNTNALTKYIEEKTGVELEFYEFPSSGGSEKLNVMLSSGSELPDIICGFNIAQGTFLKYAEDGIFVDLTPYMDKYGYYINEMADKTVIENFEAYLKSSNGKKYFMPNVAEQTGNIYGGKAFINKTWLDKLGLDMPETVEDFKNVMHEFVTKDPNGNGINDEIGFTGSSNGWHETPVNFLMRSFIYDDDKYGYVVEDGKISFNFTSDKYKEGLKFVSDMAKNKELDIQCYTQDSDTLRSICSGDTVTVGAFASGSPDVLFGDNIEVLADYVALPPLKGSDGTAYALTSPLNVQCGGVITKYCEHPAAAFRVLDLFLSEETSLLSRYGVKGTDWKEVDENTPCIFESIGAKSRIMPILQYGSIQNSHWNQYNPSFRSKDISDTMAWDGDPLNGEYIKGQALLAYVGKGPEETFSDNMVRLDADEMEELAEMQNEVNTFVKEQIALFVSGENDVDADWDSFQQQLKNLNIERYTELLQKGYDNFKSSSN